ncbi:MAG: hypothetical protein WD512_12000 [Candidatus Paceibacterota bacterium]
MGETEIVINLSELFSADGKLRNDVYTSGQFVYADIKYALIFHFKDDIAKNDPENKVYNWYITAGVKLIEIPMSLSSVDFAQVISIYKGSERYELRSEKHAENYVNWRTTESINNNYVNNSPIGMGYRTSFSTDSLKKKWLHPDNTLRFKVGFKNYMVKENMSHLMNSIASYLIEQQNTQKKQNKMMEQNKMMDQNNAAESNNQDQNGSQINLRGGELQTLRMLISNLEKDNEKLNRMNEKLQSDIIKKEDEKVQQLEMTEKLKKINTDSLVLVNKTKEEMNELRDRNKKLEQNVGNCNLSDALKKFQPENTRWEENNVSALKESLLKIFQLETIIQEKINYNESCHTCHKATRQCAMAPCGHLAYCIPCYSKIEESLKQPTTTQSTDQTTTTQSTDQTTTTQKVLKCPICSIEVANVIKVKN